MKKLLFIMLLGFGIGIFDAAAQCPMCKTAVESGMDDENGHSKGRGLNNGILYLLATPYLAVAAIGYLWYRNHKKP